jgi:hypothetical protein
LTTSNRPELQDTGRGKNLDENPLARGELQQVNPWVRQGLIMRACSL